MYTIFITAAACLSCLLIYLIVKPDPSETEEGNEQPVKNRYPLLLSWMTYDHLWTIDYESWNVIKDGKPGKIVDRNGNDLEPYSIMGIQKLVSILHRSKLIE